MNKIKNKLKLILILSLVAIIVFSSRTIFEEHTSENEYLDLSQEHEALDFFKHSYPEYTIIKASEGDITGNELDDLVIIYNKNIDQNSMLVLLNKGQGIYEETEESPAPAENQEIEFKNIDEEHPMEFIVSGSKGPHFGLAIFRVSEGELIDIFADGFENCC